MHDLVSASLARITAPHRAAERLAAQAAALDPVAVLTPSEPSPAWQVLDPWQAGQRAAGVTVARHLADALLAVADGPLRERVGTALQIERAVALKWPAGVLAGEFDAWARGMGLVSPPAALDHHDAAPAAQPEPVKVKPSKPLPEPGVVTRANLIENNKRRWPGIEAHLRHADRNGLAAAKRARNQWHEETALQIARDLRYLKGDDIGLDALMRQFSPDSAGHLGVHWGN